MTKKAISKVIDTTKNDSEIMRMMVDEARSRGIQVGFAKRASSKLSMNLETSQNFFTEDDPY